MVRRFGVLCVFVLLVTACSGSGGGDNEAPPTPSSIVPSSSTATATATSAGIPTSTTTIAASTTTGPPSLGLERPVLIVNRNGVFHINVEGTIRQLITGPVVYAVDDTRGGLLFQVERGRKTFAGFEGEPPSGRPTIIWWIPAGASVPQELLVPTPGAGQYLSLHDAFAIGESFAVVYERHEGTVPFDSDDGNVADMADTLRVFDVASGSVTQLYRVRGWEWNLADVTAGGGLVSATELQLYGSGCQLLDAATGEFVASPGFPSATPACFDDFTQCATSCALTANAAQVAYDWVSGKDGGVEWEIAVADLTTGTETSRFSVSSERWFPAELDIDGDLVLLNRTREGLFEEPALIVDTSDLSSAPTPLPIPGRARFVTQAINIAASAAVPVYVPSGLDYYRYDDDGLFRVVGGTETQLMDGPVERVWDDHMGGVITADVTAIDILHLPSGDTTPTRLFRQSSDDYAYAYARFAGVLDGHPSLFFAGIPEGAELDQWPCGDWALNSRDLLTGEERRHLCLPIEDAGFDIRSTGGDRFVGAPYGQCGGTFTSSSIQFWDLTGNPVDVPANPHPPTASCAPCELDALISPDGTQLAYRHRPDSFHPDSPHYSGPGCGGGAEQVEAWWEGSKDVPAEIIVMDIDTGETPWRIEISADSQMNDFDGRYVVVSQKGESLIYDTWEQRPPVRVSDKVTLTRPIAPLDR